MKRYIIPAVITLCVCLLAACDTKEKFDYKAHNNLYFEVEDNLQMNFFYRDRETVSRETIYVTVKVSGGPRDYARAINLKPVTLDKKEMLPAEVNTHFLPLDNPETAGEMVMPAGKVETRVPIILLRHPSLREDAYYLALQVEPNKDFATETATNLVQNIDIMDMPFRPSNWDDWGTVGNFFGLYNVVKHEFMIKVAGEPVDADWIDRVFSLSEELEFFTSLFKSELKKFNEDPANIASGDAPLRDGEYIVTFERGF